MSTSVAELFERDPLGLSDQDIDAIVAYMRERREDFKNKKTSTARKKTTAAAASGVDVEVNL